MKILITLLSLLLFGCSQYTVHQDNTHITTNKNQDHPYVVMISIDGFRHDFIKMYDPPFLSSIVKKGIQAQRLTPAFPSKTFPNHYSLVTGMYPGSHGLIANRFKDPEWNENYRLGDNETTRNGKWYGGTPLWLETQNQGLLSASFFWVGSDANIQGRYPNYYIPYDHGLDNKLRTQQITEWLKMSPQQRPHLLHLYFSDVDSMGHRYGPKSDEVKEAVLRIDKLIGDMASDIDRLNLPVNFVIVSDHGMTAIENAKKVYLRNFMDTSLAEFQERGPLTFIYVKEKKNIKQVKKSLRKVPFTQVMSRKDLPPSYHLAHNKRAGDLVLLAEPGAYIYPHKTPPTNPVKEGISGGTHGYDPYLSKDMGGIFLAYGPQVKRAGLIKTIDNIHVYPFVLDLLGLKQKKGIDGDPYILSGYKLAP